MASLLVREGVRERRADRAILVTDEEIDVRNFVAFASQGFADVHRHAQVPAIQVVCFSTADTLPQQ